MVRNREIVCTTLALFVCLWIPSSRLAAAIVPLGDVSPSNIGQSPSQSVIIGIEDIGGLVVDAGSVLTTLSGILGQSELSIGAATITGTGSQWTNSGFLYVGQSGMGFVDVESGGKLSSAATHLGGGSLSTGTVTISGVGSEWISSGQLNIGGAGSGTVVIEAGGEVSGAAANLGRDPGSLGTATVAGVGSKWTNIALLVGGSGSGTLTIEAGGEVTSSNVSYLGYHPGAAGTASITGVGSKWTNISTLHVGYRGSGTLIVADGGEVVAATLYASLNDLLGNGTITATTGAVLDSDFLFDSAHGNQATFSFGSGGTLDVTVAGGDLGVSNGSVTVSEGVNISSRNGYLGYSSGSTGTAMVTGAGSKWTNSNGVVVGDSGNGSLTIEAGAQVSSNFGYLARGVGSTGTVKVADEGSKWTNNSGLFVGNTGTGLLTIEGGGQVTSNFGNISGDQPGSTGTAIVKGVGSKWTNHESFTVGRAGTGTLIIEAGGQVTTGGVLFQYDAILGWSSGSTGTATVTGVGSKWTSHGLIRVGDFGNGSLTIEAGGLVSSNSGYLGYRSGSTGTITVTGADSKWTTNSLGPVYVGYDGNGALIVEAGGQVINTSSSYLGYNSGSTGTVVVTGPGSKWTNGELYVGYNGSGSLTISGGGLVMAEVLTIDRDLVGDSFINMATGGILALWGNANDSLSQFLNLASGTDAIRYWDASMSGWAPLTAATYGDDYTLSYITTGDLNGYTLLTVGRVGDFDNDGDVDGRDFLAWQRNPELGDLADWQAAFGTGVSLLANSVTVPEPSTRLLTLLVALFALAVARNRSYFAL